jgi:hypothetical protein
MKKIKSGILLISSFIHTCISLTFAARKVMFGETKKAVAAKKIATLLF